MKAIDLKQKAFTSINAEIADLETRMTAEAEKGMLKMEVKSLSDAAKQYLVDNGFEVKIFLDIDVKIDKNKYTISWGR